MTALTRLDPIDVTDKGKDDDVRAEIPGAKKEDIRVKVNGNFVSVSAEIRKDKEEIPLAAWC